MHMVIACKLIGGEVICSGELKKILKKNRNIVIGLLTGNSS